MLSAVLWRARARGQDKAVRKEQPREGTTTNGTSPARVATPCDGSPCRGRGRVFHFCALLGVGVLCAQERLKLVELSKLVGSDLQINDRITVLTDAIEMIKVCVSASATLRAHPLHQCCVEG
jgi:hypothetical protein